MGDYQITKTKTTHYNITQCVLDDIESEIKNYDSNYNVYQMPQKGERK